MKKVLMVVTTPQNKSDYKGGIATICSDYISKRGDFEKRGFILNKFDYHPTPNSLYYKIKSSKIKNVMYGFLQYKYLKKELRSNPVDTIHIHTSRKWLFIKDLLLTYFIKRNFEVKTCMTIHVGDIKTVFPSSHWQKWLIALMNKNIAKVIFLSAKMQDDFVKAGLDLSRTSLLYNFYNIDLPKDKNISKVPQIIYLGSINREKGINELLEASLKIKYDFKLHICGTIIEESIRKSFEEALMKSEDKIIYHGYVDKANKIKLLTNADFLVLPSYREGLPVSVIEAMAAGCGLIVTPVGAIPEIIEDQENALIIDAANADSLQSAIERLLTDKDLLLKMQSTNRTYASRFDVKNHIKQLALIYNSL